MTHPTIAELRNLYQDITHDRAAAAGPWNTESLRYDMARIIGAYRDMAIKAGEWPCVCGDAGAVHSKDRLSGEYHFHTRYITGRTLACTYTCPCPEYRPEELL